jgi:hypothetical protein
VAPCQPTVYKSAVARRPGSMRCSWRFWRCIPVPLSSGVLAARCSRRISSSGHGRPDRFRLDHQTRPARLERSCTAINCNPSADLEPEAVLASASDGPAIGTAAIRRLYEQLLADRPRFSGDVRPALRMGDLALTSTRFRGAPLRRSPGVSAMADGCGSPISQTSSDSGSATASANGDPSLVRSLSGGGCTVWPADLVDRKAPQLTARCRGQWHANGMAAIGGRTSIVAPSPPLSSS